MRNLIIGFIFGAILLSGQATASRQFTQWDYRWVNFSKPGTGHHLGYEGESEYVDVDMMRQMGNQGWELCGVRNRSRDGEYTQFIFKRPRN